MNHSASMNENDEIHCLNEMSLLRENRMPINLLARSLALSRLWIGVPKDPYSLRFQQRLVLPCLADINLAHIAPIADKPKFGGRKPRPGQDQRRRVGPDSSLKPYRVHSPISFACRSKSGTALRTSSKVPVAKTFPSDKYTTISAFLTVDRR